MSCSNIGNKHLKYCQGPSLGKDRDTGGLRKIVRLDVQWPSACIEHADMHVQTSPLDSR